MKALHWWILLLAVLTFSAGLISGLVVHDLLHPSTPLVGVYADYEKKWVHAFDPDAAQLKMIRKLLLTCQLEEEKIKNRYAQTLGPDLHELSSFAEKQLLKILTPSQHAKYEKLLQSGEELIPPSKKG